MAVYAMYSQPAESSLRRLAQRLSRLRDRVGDDQPRLSGSDAVRVLRELDEHVITRVHDDPNRLLGSRNLSHRDSCDVRHDHLRQRLLSLVECDRASAKWQSRRPWWLDASCATHGERILAGVRQK